MLISVCLPTVGRPCLGEALDAVRAAADRADPDVEVLVADASGSLPLDLEGARVLPNRSGGASAGRNACAQAALGELLVFVDDDCLLAEDALARLSELATSDSAIAFAGLTRRQEGGSRLERAWLKAGFGAYFDLAARFPRLGWAPSCNLTVRRAAFEAVGGFPLLDVPVGGEDVLFGVALTEAGLGPIRSAPDVVVTHRAIDHDDLGALLEKAHHYGRADQLVAQRCGGTRGPPRRRLFGESPAEQLRKAFDRGRRSVCDPPLSVSLLALAEG